MGVFKVTLPLCIFGILSEVSSWSKFLTYHIRSVVYQNAQAEDMANLEVFQRYSDLVIIVLMIFLIDPLRCKTFLIFKSLLPIVLCALIQWTNTVGAARLAIIIHSFYSCCDVAYTVYMFEKVSSDHFLAVASLARTGLLTGCLFKALMLTVLSPNDVFNSHTYWPLLIQSPIIIIASILLNFNRVQSSNSSVQSESCCVLAKLQTAIPNTNGIFYSIWYIFGSGVFYQFVALEESFISDFHSLNDEVSLHAFLMVVAILLSIVFVLFCSFIHHKHNALYYLAAVSFVSSILIFLTANINSRFVMYVSFLPCYIIHHTSIAISSAEIAKGTPQGSYGLTFGINTFLAICVRVVIENIVEPLNRSQSYNCMGGILVFVGFIYILFMLIFFARKSNRGVI